MNSAPSSSKAASPPLQLTIPASLYPPSKAASPPLQLTIPESLYPPSSTHRISRSVSPAPSSWAHPYSPSHDSTSPSSSKSHVSAAPAFPESPPERQNDQSHSDGSDPQWVGVPMPEDPAEGSSSMPQVHRREPRSPGVASLVELAIYTPCRTDLMGETFRPPSPEFPSPIPRVPTHHPNGARSRRSLLSISTKPLSPPTSPASAAALSSPVTQTVKRSDVVTRGRKDAQSSGTGPGGQQSRHSQFYMRDEMVVLDVNDCLYRVHRHLLERNSEFFNRLLSGCQNKGIAIGSSDDTAISIPDVLQNEFDCLLNFLYYRVFEGDGVSLDEWIVLLDISTRLRFSKIRASAIREIGGQRESLTAVDIIALAIKHDIPGWLPQAYADLCRRAHPLDDLEAELLGARITARIGRARETIRDETFRAFQQKRYGSRYAPPDALDEELVSRVVMDVFGLASSASHT